MQDNRLLAKISAPPGAREEDDQYLAAAYETLGRVYYDRGVLYDEVADVDRAIAALDRSLTLDPRQTRALAGRAAARQYKGDIAGALADYDAAIALAPRNAQLSYSRAAVHEAAGERAAAIEDYSTAISLQPSFDAYLARGELYDQEGKRNQAIDDRRLALKYADDDRTRLVATTWLSRFGANAEVIPQTGTTVFVHIVDPNDMDVANAVKLALEKQGYRIGELAGTADEDDHGLGPWDAERSDRTRQRSSIIDTHGAPNGARLQRYSEHSTRSDAFRHEARPTLAIDPEYSKTERRQSRQA